MARAPKADAASVSLVGAHHKPLKHAHFPDALESARTLMTGTAYPDRNVRASVNTLAPHTGVSPPPNMNIDERNTAIPSSAATVPADDVALLLNADNLDLLEKMEFYQWLHREPGALADSGAAPSKRERRS